MRNEFEKRPEQRGTKRDGSEGFTLLLLSDGLDSRYKVTAREGWEGLEYIFLLIPQGAETKTLIVHNINLL
jgi:hypothetical protein